LPHGTTSRWRYALGACAAAALALVIAGAPPLRAQTGQPANQNVAHGSGGINSAEMRNAPYVVLISFDAFRADYLDSLTPPNLTRMMRQGVRAKGLIPIFPSKTFPNHYSIVTGLYAEHHGIVANSFYDPVRQAGFKLADTNAVRDGSWYRGEPLWVTAERQGMVTASYQWPASEAAIEGVRPSYFTHYNATVPDSARADTVLGWLRLPASQRPHFVTLYATDVDEAGHHFGPGSPQVAAAVTTVDNMLGRLMDGIRALPIRDSVYVIVVSDHGMARTAAANYASLPALIDTTGVRIADAGPNANLHVAGGAAHARAIRDSLNRVLTHGRAYLREEVPARLHYSADPRVGDVVIVLDEPFLVGISPRPPRDSATHGWDPVYPEMHGIFLVTGPGVRRETVSPEVANIDIYPFVTELLGLHPAAEIDGCARRIWSVVMEEQRLQKDDELETCMARRESGVR
jgi:predicted AlkP superfamily pyrophosphatase or phosphodiesterase